MTYLVGAQQLTYNSLLSSLLRNADFTSIRYIYSIIIWAVSQINSYGLHTSNGCKCLIWNQFLIVVRAFCDILFWKPTLIHSLSVYSFTSCHVLFFSHSYFFVRSLFQVSSLIKICSSQVRKAMLPRKKMPFLLWNQPVPFF